MGVGPGFRAYISTLYSKAASSILVNGELSELFNPSRGVRQGCSLSPLLYVLSLEPFSQMVRDNANIRGLRLPGGAEVKLSQYADDNSGILADDLSILHFVQDVSVYEKGSGARLNKGKTKGLWLGRWRGRSSSPVPGIDFVSTFLVLLGEAIGNIDMAEENWRRRAAQLELGSKQQRHHEPGETGRARRGSGKFQDVCLWFGIEESTRGRETSDVNKPLGVAGPTATSPHFEDKDKKEEDIPPSEKVAPDRTATTLPSESGDVEIDTFGAGINVMTALNIPLELDDNYVRNRLREYGEVLDSKYVSYASQGFPEILTGTRQYRIRLKSHVHNTMRLGDETFSFRYAGQPRLCHRCGREGHLFADCDEDKCSMCMGLGHLAQDCTSGIKCNVCGEEGHAGRSCQLNFPSARGRETSDVNKPLGVAGPTATSPHFEDKDKKEEDIPPSEKVAPDRTATTLPSESGDVEIDTFGAGITVMTALNIPLELDDNYVRNRLREYGEVLDSKYVSYASQGFPEILTGTRQYRIRLKSHVHNTMRLGDETFSFRYAGQPRLCHRCGREGHLFADCDEDKCSKCMGLCHLAQDCTSGIKCNVCGEEWHAGRSCQLNFPYRLGGRVLEHRLVGRVLVVRNLTLGLMNNNQLGWVLMMTKWHLVGQTLVRNRLYQESRVRALPKSPRSQKLVRNRLCQESQKGKNTSEEEKKDPCEDDDKSNLSRKDMWDQYSQYPPSGANKLPSQLEESDEHKPLSGENDSVANIHLSLEESFTNDLVMDLNEHIESDVESSVCSSSQMGSESESDTQKDPVPSVQRGRGLWKCNVKVLSDPRLEEEFREKYPMWRKSLEEGQSAREWWDTVKSYCKDLVIKYSKLRAQADSLIQKGMERKVDSLRSRLNVGDRSPATREEYETEKENLNNLILDRLKGQRLRAKVRAFEEDEKPTRFFFQAERRKGQKRVIQEVRDDSGDVVTTTPQILAVFKQFYTDLYRAGCIDEEEQEYFLSKLSESLPDDCVESLDGNLTLAELEAAVKGMENGKSPGSDGLPKEFYIKFREIIGPDFLEVLNEGLDVGQLSESQREGVISLLEKKGDQLNPANKRPISLLNVDYKILSKALANRLKNVIASVVHIDRSCGIPGRSIEDSVCLLRDIVEYVNGTNSSGVLIALDQEKAFDRVDHKFMANVLDKLGFGPNLKRMIASLYCEVSSRVLVNGTLSE
ncbi:ZCCHC3 [Branchiostoma lanceolatum]|uniref:ZCCHC3 protein n=1 Tax=Branchiostoma lanceolatum TaxID=7740 RepID=A0A8J9YKB7_BRALA|nr:ZCCHC3 [Branchiostoma lanceolatum]